MRAAGRNAYTIRELPEAGHYGAHTNKDVAKIEVRQEDGNARQRDRAHDTSADNQSRSGLHEIK